MLDFSDITDLLNQYVRSELIILIPVLGILHRLINNTKQKRNASLIVTIISIFLTGIYTFATASELNNFYQVLFATFASITQGTMFSGISLYGKSLLNFNKCDCKHDSSQDPDPKNEK